jgi:hypothetical protein
MIETLSKALVLTMLHHAEDFPWRMQDIGLMGLGLMVALLRRQLARVPHEGSIDDGDALRACLEPSRD